MKTTIRPCSLKATSHSHFIAPCLLTDKRYGILTSRRERLIHTEARERLKDVRGYVCYFEWGSALHCGPIPRVEM